MLMYPITNQEGVSDRINALKITVILLGVQVKPHSEMRIFVKYVFIFELNWTEYTYVAVVFKEITTHKLYKPPFFCDELV